MDASIQTCTYKCAPIVTCTASAYRYQNFWFEDENGTKRKFPIYTDTGAICLPAGTNTTSGSSLDATGYWMSAAAGVVYSVRAPDVTQVYTDPSSSFVVKIGRASCRERV